MTQLSTNVESFLPAGIVLPYAGAGAAPDTWELCNGQTVSKTDEKYSKLYAAIGTTYGDAGTNFKLPALNVSNGPFIRGGTTPSGETPISDSTKISSLTSSSGSAHLHGTSGSSTGGQSQSHTHTTTIGNKTSGGYSVSHRHGSYFSYLYSGMVGNIHVAEGTRFSQVDYTGGSDYKTGYADSDHTHTTDIGSPVSGNTSQDHTHANTVTINNESAHTHTISNAVAETAPKHMVMRYIIKL